MVQKSESTHSYRWAYALGGGGACMRGAYTWSNTSVKEKVAISARGLCAGRLIGGEIRYLRYL